MAQFISNDEFVAVNGDQRYEEDFGAHTEQNFTNKRIHAHPNTKSLVNHNQRIRLLPAYSSK